MNLATALTLRSFWITKVRAARLRTRDDLLRWQARKLRRFLARTAPRAKAYAQLAGHPLADFPVMDKAALMGAFERFNAAGIAAQQAWNAIDGTGQIGRYSIGASTGTSGNRGLYVVSDAERYLWLGTLLAKALPDLLQTRYRVAVLLPRGSRLYDAANESGRLALRFFDLADGVQSQVQEVCAFRPTVLVAPPHALLELARADTDLRPLKIFSAAEVLDPEDRVRIEGRFGTRVREIYMATEGLLGVACPEGTLHLCEDCVAFEWEREGDLASPLITDFTRRTQMMIRYRMNDLVRMAEAPCPCGSPLQVVSEVAGRCDDAFRLARNGAGKLTVTPDVIRNAVVGASATINDFRVIQTGEARVRLLLPPENAGELVSARNALEGLFRRLGTAPDIEAAIAVLAPPAGGKLRRVVREPEALP